MRKATKSDKKLVIDILSNTFCDMPGVTWMLRKCENRKKQICHLAEFAFVKSLARDGVYISDNEQGVALCYKFNKKVNTFKETLYELKYAFTSLNFKLIPKLLKVEKLRKEKRPDSGEYLYFWFFGVKKGGGNAGYEIKNGIFNISKELNIPIYAETSLRQNKIVYERYGFETFDVFQDEKLCFNYWFMKWEPNK